MVRPTLPSHGAESEHGARMPPRRAVPATVAGALEAARRSLAPSGRAAGPFDVELLAARPLHHPLEMAGLFGLLSGLAAAAPALRTRLWLRSALAADQAFATLPAAARRRLPDGAAAAGAAALAEIAAGGAACILVGADDAWEERLGGLPLWWHAPLRQDFQWRLPAGRDAEEAVRAFRTAVAAVTPSWIANLSGAAPARRADRQAAPAVRRLLIHQARSHLGDALWLTPLVRAARRRFPHAAITILAAPGQVDLLAAHRRIADVLPLPDGASRQALAATLAGRHFDAALFAFARRPRTRWLAEAAAAQEIPWRVNLEYYDRADDGLAPSPLFTHEGWFFWGSLPSPRLLLHALDPLAPSPTHDDHPPPSPLPGRRRPAGAETEWRLDLPLAAPWRREAARALAATGIGDRPFAVLAPGARSSARWPARKFAALAVHLAAELGLHVLVEGGPGDAAALAEVERWLRRRQGASVATPDDGLISSAAPGDGLIAIRRDSAGALAALLARASLLVSNDSAPIHLAALAATPTLYFAHREKLVHSHPGGAHCRALYDAARNRPARIPVSAARAAVAAMARDGLLSGAPAAAAAAHHDPSAGALRAGRCEPPSFMLHFPQQIDRLLLPCEVQTRQRRIEGPPPADSAPATGRRQA